MKIAVVENEEKDIQVYKEYISKYQESTKERIEAVFFQNGIDAITDYPKELDAIFMDIDMPMIDGLETSKKIREKDSDVIIIFVTNLSQFAIQGYKVQALDFLLKPIEYMDFKFEIDKIKRNTNRKGNDFIWVSTKGTTIRLSFKNIISIEIFHHDLIIKTNLKDNPEFKFRGSLQAISEKLDNSMFARINNYSIVNLSYVKEIRKEDVILQDGTSVLFSRNRKKDFIDAFTSFMNGDIAIMISKILFANFYNLYLEFFIAQFIFMFNGQRRKYYWWRLLIAAVAGCGFYFLPTLNFLDFNWSYSIVFLSILIVGFFLYKKPSMIFVCTITGYALQHLTWNTMELFFELAYPNEDVLSRAGAIAYYLSFLFVFYFSTFLIIWKRKVFIDFDIISPSTIIATLVVLVVSLILSEKVKKWDYILRLYSIVSSLLAILVVSGAFKLSDNQKKQIELEQNNRMLQSLIEEKANQQKLAKETIDIINMKAHDMKNQISVLKNLNQAEQSSYIDEMSKSIDIYNDIAKTGNDVLDIVLTQKSLLCTSKHIKFTYICDGVPFQKMDPMDATALFANLLDNAVEAVEKEDEENRIIKLNANIKGNFICIHMENYCSKDIKFVNGVPQTGKEDKSKHGFGTKSIMYIAQKYNGNVTFSYKENIFSVNILMPV